MRNILIAVFITALVGYFYSTYQFKQGIELGKKEQIALQAQVDDKVRTDNENMRNFIAEELSKIRIENKTIYQKATKEVVSEKVYSDCIVTPDGLRYANDALRAKDKN